MMQDLAILALTGVLVLVVVIAILLRKNRQVLTEFLYSFPFRLSRCPSACLSVCPVYSITCFIYGLSVCLSVCLSVFPFVCLYLCLLSSLLSRKSGSQQDGGRSQQDGGRSQPAKSMPL